MAGFLGDATPSLNLPETSSIQAAFSSATASNPELAKAFLQYQPGTIGFAEFAFSLNSSTSNCVRQGAFPVPLAPGDLCLSGWHCPNSDAQHPPSYCAPTEVCAISRTARQTCADPQGRYEPQICPAGSYCPPGGKQVILCPKGYFCPQGSFEPWKCSVGAICDAGSSRQVNIAPLLVVIILDVILLVLVFVGLGIAKWSKKRHKRYTTLDAGADDIELLKHPRKISGSPRIDVTSPSGKSRPPEPNWPATHNRRSSGHSEDSWTGYPEDDNASLFDDDPMEEESFNSPDFQRFIQSMTKTIETNSIGLSFEFEMLSFQTKKGKKILQDVNGTMPRGSCWGVMGGSGAGKSTFLNVLMGKQVATGGAIKINGWVKDMSRYRKLIGYVPQDDIVFPELTVRENILHSARIRLPSSWKDKAIQDHVDALIACLQLTHVQHSRVGDATNPVISGGQRKRVNIGMELAAAPMAIFLDEPTSGLDSTSAASIMKLLRAISRLGVTVIAIIHQPREQIFYGFDHLLLLAQGRSVYSGLTDEVQGYFESLGFAFPNRANPADVIIDIITGDGAQYTSLSGRHDTDVATLINQWRNQGKPGHGILHNRHLSADMTPTSTTSPSRPASPSRKTRHRSSSNTSRHSTQSLHSTAEQETNLKRTMKARGATWPAQVYHCFKRSCVQQIRNSTSFFFEIGVGGLAGIVIGLSAFAANGHLFQGVYQPPFIILSPAVDYSSIPQLGLLGGMAIGLAASAPGFWVFGEEKLMYWRETASGHSRSAYYVGKVLSTLLRIGLSALHFTVFLGILATPLISWQKMYLANVLYFWCIYGLASVVSMVVKREDGPLLAVLASLIIGVLGGVAPPLSKVKTWHMEWFWRLSPGVWFTEAYVTENVSPLGYLYILDAAAQTLGYTLGQYTLDVGILLAIGCVYRVIAYLFLIMIHRDKQR